MCTFPMTLDNAACDHVVSQPVAADVYCTSAVRARAHMHMHGSLWACGVLLSTVKACVYVTQYSLSSDANRN